MQKCYCTIVEIVYQSKERSILVWKNLFVNNCCENKWTVLLPPLKKSNRENIIGRNRLLHKDSYFNGDLAGAFKKHKNSFYFFDNSQPVYCGFIFSFVFVLFYISFLVILLMSKNTVGQKKAKIQAKKLVKWNESMSKINFGPNSIICNFKNGQ